MREGMGTPGPPTPANMYTGNLNVGLPDFASQCLSQSLHSKVSNFNRPKMAHKHKIANKYKKRCSTFFTYYRNADQNCKCHVTDTY